MKPYDDRLREIMQYGPPSDSQRTNADIYMPSDLERADDLIWDEPRVSFPTADGYALKEGTKWGPPTPSALEKFMLKQKRSGQVDY